MGLEVASQSPFPSPAYLATFEACSTWTGAGLWHQSTGNAIQKQAVCPLIALAVFLCHSLIGLYSASLSEQAFGLFVFRHRLPSSLILPSVSLCFDLMPRYSLSLYRSQTSLDYTDWTVQLISSCSSSSSNSSWPHHLWFGFIYFLFIIFQ